MLFSYSKMQAYELDFSWISNYPAKKVFSQLRVLVRRRRHLLFCPLFLPPVFLPRRFLSFRLLPRLLAHLHPPLYPLRLKKMFRNYINYIHLTKLKQKMISNSNCTSFVYFPGCWRWLNQRIKANRLRGAESRLAESREAGQTENATENNTNMMTTLKIIIKEQQKKKLCNSHLV